MPGSFTVYPKAGTGNAYTVYPPAADGTQKIVTMTSEGQPAVTVRHADTDSIIRHPYDTGPVPPDADADEPQ